MALSHVRKALGTQAGGQEWVSLQRGKVHIHPDINVYTDYEFFTNEAQNALQYAENGNPYAIYAGTGRTVIHRQFFAGRQLCNKIDYDEI